MNRYAIIVMGAFVLAASMPARADEQTDWLKARKVAFATQQAPRSAQTTKIWDAPNMPQMIVIPAGEYTMGSASTEAGRKANESPRHRVRISYSLTVGKYNVTRDEFGAFVEDTGYKAKDNDGCYHPDSAGKWGKDASADWRRPGIEQTGEDPVVCVGWNDITAYIQWLSRKSGQHYRLLSEAEWEYAARAGTKTTYYWGDTVGSGHANCDGCGSKGGGKHTAPSGSLAPNGFGLYDMAGNAWQLNADCWNESYAAAPSDGSAMKQGNCARHVMRGGSWSADPGLVRAAFRGWVTPDDRSCDNGFRVARELK